MPLTRQQIDEYLPVGFADARTMNRPAGQRHIYDQLDRLRQIMRGPYKAGNQAIAPAYRLVGEAVLSIHGGTQQTPQRKQAVDQAIDDGSFAQSLIALYADLAPNNDTVTNDPELKQKMREEILRTAASLEIGNAPGFTVPEAYRQAAREVNEAAKEQRLLNEEAKSMLRVPQQTAYNNLEALKREAAAPDFVSSSRETFQKHFAAVFATRTAARARRGKPYNLQHHLMSTTDTALQYEKTYEWIRNSAALGTLTGRENREMVSLLTDGHGGAAEEVFTRTVKEGYMIEPDTPDRYMPTAKDRIEYLRDEIKRTGEQFGYGDDDTVHLYAEVFLAREAVGAVTGEGKKLESKMDPAVLKKGNLKNDPYFKAFVQENARELYDTIQKGHGGKAEEMFRSYCNSLEVIPADFPPRYTPTALQRTENLKELIGSRKFGTMSEAEQDAVYREQLAARLAVNSIPGNKNSLNVRLDPAAVSKASTRLKANPLLNGPSSFLATASREDLREWAKQGHGGKLEEKFCEFVAQKAVETGRVPDVPARFLTKVPAQLLQEQAGQLYGDIKSDMQQRRATNNGAWLAGHPEEVKKAAAKALIYARDAMEPIKRPIDSAQVEEDAQKMMDSPAFRKMFDDLGPAGVADKIIQGRADLVEAYAQAGHNLQQAPQQPAVGVPAAGIVQEGLQPGPQGPAAIN